jgi:hypothetical protein
MKAKRDTINVTVHFLAGAQFRGLAGSSGPSQSISLEDSRSGTFSRGDWVVDGEAFSRSIAVAIVVNDGMRSSETLSWLWLLEDEEEEEANDGAGILKPEMERIGEKLRVVDKTRNAEWRAQVK